MPKLTISLELTPEQHLTLASRIAAINAEMLADEEGPPCTPFTLHTYLQDLIDEDLTPESPARDVTPLLDRVRACLERRD